MSAATRRIERACDGNYRLDWTYGPDVLNGLEDEWDQLASSAPDATVFATWAWSRGALTLDRGRTPAVAWLRSGERLVGALPLTIGREVASGIPIRSARLAGFPMTDRFTPLVAMDAPGATEALLDGALGLDVDVLFLTEVLESEGAAGAVRHWIRTRGLRAASRLASQARVVPVKHGDGAALEASYSSKHRSNVRRSRRRLEELGALGFDYVVPAPEAIEPLVARLKAVEDQAWQGRLGSGLFSTAGRLTWLTGILVDLAADRRVAAQVMTIDGNDVMYVFGMCFSGTFYWYNTAFVPDTVKGSAFQVLMHELLPNLRRSGIHAIDSSRNTLGAENSLDRLQPMMVEHLHFAVFRNVFPAGIYRSALVHVRPRFQAIRARLHREARPTHNWTPVGDGAAPGIDGADT